MNTDQTTTQGAGDTTQAQGAGDMTQATESKAVPTDGKDNLIAALELRVQVLETHSDAVIDAVRRVLKHLDPLGTSMSLFPEEF